MTEAVAVAANESILPIGAAAEASPARHAERAAPEATPAQLAEERYSAAVQKLLDDALEHRHMEPLAEALTYQLARIGFGYGISAVGDIVTRLGKHLAHVAAREAAEAEAKQAKKAGSIQ